MQDDPREITRKIKAIRARVPDATDDEILSFLEQESSLPSAAPADRLDQTIRNPEGQDPLVKYGVPAAKLYATVAGGVAGGGAGLALAKRVAGAGGKKVLGRMGLGAAAGVAGGVGARATSNVVNARNPVEGLLSPKNVAIDAALGGAIPAVGALAGGMKKLAGYSPKATRAQTLQNQMENVTERTGLNPNQMEATLAQGGVAPLHPTQAVMDLDPQFQGMASSAARHSPKAERELQEFVANRATVPTEGILKDTKQALGGKAADVASSLKKMRKVIKAHDQTRFNPLWTKYPDAIVEPTTMAQVDAIFANVGSAKNALASDQSIALKPIKEVLQKVTMPGQHTMVSEGRFTVPVIGKAVEKDAVTLKGLHRLKTMLDKVINAGDKAEAAGTLTGDAAIHIGSIKTARQQLMDLPLEGVKGADEFKAALAASSRERKVADALKEGAKAATAKVSPVGSREALQDFADPEAQRAYRAGLAGQITLKARETGKTWALTRSQNLAQKIKEAAVSPAAAAERTQRLPAWQMMEATNKMQENVRPPAFSLGGTDEAAGIAGTLGGSQAVGQVLGGNPVGAKQGLLLYLGNKLFRGAISRNRAAQQQAWEEISEWLKMQPGQEAADTYRALLSEFGKLRRGQTIRSATTAGGITGALAGQREP